MGKKTICGGGSGSNGEGVSYCESLMSELRGPDIPAHAKTKRDFMRESGASLSRITEVLAREVAAGNLEMQYKIFKGHITSFFWPKKKATSHSASDRKRPIRD